MRAQIELTTPDGVARHLAVDARVEIGREDTDVVVADPSVSRRHLAFDVTTGTLTVEDLGSTYGTVHNGRPLEGCASLAVGDEVRFGDSTVRVVEVSAAATGADPVVRPLAPNGPGPRMETIERGGLRVGFVPGTFGERIAPSVLDTAHRARRRLVGFGSEPWGQVVTLHLVDPFPSAESDGSAVVDGSVIDVENAAVWLPVTPESTPEHPSRLLSIVFGAALPAADRVAHLVEGYGLQFTELAPIDPGDLADHGGAIAQLPDEIRTRAAASFVQFLLAREGDAAFRRLVSTPASTLDAAWVDIYGRSEAVLETLWWNEQRSVTTAAGVRDFLRLSWRYLAPHRLRQIEVFALMLVSLAFTATYPFVVQELFDGAIPSGEMAQVLTLLAVLAAAFVVSSLAGLRRSHQASRIAGSIVRDLRAEMFAKLQRVPDAWVGRHSQGDVLSRFMNDVGQVQDGLSAAVTTGAFHLVSVVVASVIMLRISVPLGIIVLLGAPLVAIVYRRMSAGARTRSLAVHDEAGTVLEVAAESYVANPVIKVFGLAGREERRLARASDRLLRAELRMTLFGGLFGLSVDGIVTVLRLGVIGFGTWLIFEGQFTLGGLVAFLGIMGEVLAPVAGLTTLGQSIQVSVGALVRVDELLSAETEPSGEDLPPVPTLRSGVEFAGVALSYSPERRALDGVDVTIAAGATTAFVGPSGSGKSTVLKVLMRLYEPDEGALLVDGRDLASHSLDSWRSQLGVVFQDSFLFDATIRENIAMGAIDPADAQILEAARVAQVDSFAAEFPRGLDTVVGEGGRNLSGGQRQRVAIARAIVRNPRLLLLDEATSALDPATERQITATLDEVATGRTVVAITHRLASIQHYDAIHVLDRGRVVESGTHDELLARDGVYAGMWAQQHGLPGPRRAPFDLDEALRPVSLFAGLDDAARHEVASAFAVVALEPGDHLDEVPGGLVVVGPGRAEVATPDERRPARTGDVIGVRAALGLPTDATVWALEPTEVWVLSADALDELAHGHPSIDAARRGRSTLTAAPSGTLVRATLGVSPARATVRASPVRATVGAPQRVDAPNPDPRRTLS